MQNIVVEHQQWKLELSENKNTRQQTEDTCAVWTESGKQFITNVFLNTHWSRMNFEYVCSALYAHNTYPCKYLKAVCKAICRDTTNSFTKVIAITVTALAYMKPNHKDGQLFIIIGWLHFLT